MEDKQEESSSRFSFTSNGNNVDARSTRDINNANEHNNVDPGFPSTTLLESDSDDADDDGDRWVFQTRPEKRQRVLAALPVGFLDPLKPEERLAMERMLPRDDHQENRRSGSIKEVPLVVPAAKDGGDSRGGGGREVVVKRICCIREFWKAGDYELAGGEYSSTTAESQVGIDHVRVHPKFLRSNATSYKWALGAFAELPDNAIDEAPKGATYVHVDVIKNKKYRNAMLMVQDNGGGMTPDDIRRCMSLGYSAKSKLTTPLDNMEMVSRQVQ